MTERPPFVCFVPGKPEPQGSARGFNVGGRVVITSDNPALKSWRRRMKAEFEEKRAELFEIWPALAECSAWPDLWGKEMPLYPPGVPVCARASFVLPRLASHPKTSRGSNPAPPMGRPDLDKLTRAVGDALEAALIVWQDAQIVEWRTSKRWAAIGEAAGVHVELAVWLD